MILQGLYRMVTGRPWTTVRSVTEEYGPPPGALYADELASYSDTEVVLYGHAVVAGIRARRRVAVVKVGR